MVIMDDYRKGWALRYIEGSQRRAENIKYAFYRNLLSPEQTKYLNWQTYMRDVDKLLSEDKIQSLRNLLNIVSSVFCLFYG